MGKLILGIIAVVVLQIAFFSYMITRPSEVYESLAKTDSVDRSPGLSPVEPLPEVVNPAPAPVAEAKDTKPKPSTITVRSRANMKPKSETRVHEDKGRDLARRSVTTTASSNHRPIKKSESSARPAGTVIPRGYTMVLVDYPPSTSYAKTHDTVLKPKKRSYLSRTLPALVKKPWRWMKSLASKLN